MKTRIDNTSETKFMEACRRMHNLANSCHNWLQLALNIRTQTVALEQGNMRSLRLARIVTGSDELTASSALQLVVLPAAFDGVRQRGLERERWQLLIYSWLSCADTARLMDYLESKTDMKGCACFLAAPAGCTRWAWR